MNPPRSDSTVAFIGDVSVSSKKISTSNFTDYIGDVSVGKMSEQRVADKVNGVRESPDNGNWFSNIKRFTASFEEEGLIGLSFGIVQAVTSTALNVVSGTASNVGHMLTNHPNNHNTDIAKRGNKHGPEEKHTPAVLQFAYNIADIVLGAVSPVLDLHFFGFGSPDYPFDTMSSSHQMLIYWDDPSVKKSIGYDLRDQCSFIGTESVLATESVYFDTRSVGFYSAITGDGRSVMDSMSVKSEDFYSAVSQEEVEEMEVEFV